MPEISRFFGIVIAVYYEYGRHQRPHFHARYGGHRASFTINHPELLAGSVPRRQQHLILVWTELHQVELLDNWQRVTEERPLLYIAGL
jgi:hypothetical protein